MNLQISEISSAPALESSSSSEFASAPALEPETDILSSDSASAPALESSQSSTLVTPLYSQLSDQLHIHQPHHQVSNQLHQMHPHQMLHIQNLEQNTTVENEQYYESVTDNMEEENSVEAVDIVPFTDTQLHALYHNYELEKNSEFVDHWLETQKNVEKFQLDEMLLNYLRVRTVLCNTQKKYNSDREKVTELDKDLWTISSEIIEEDGECEDENTVTVDKEITIAEYNQQIANSLKSRLKQCKETLTEDFSLHSFRAQLLKIQIDDFLHSVISRHQGGQVDRTLVYTSIEEIRKDMSS